MNQKELHNVSPQSASQMIDDDPPAILVNIGLSIKHGVFVCRRLAIS